MDVPTKFNGTQPAYHHLRHPHPTVGAIYKSFPKKTKFSMSTSCVNYLIRDLSWVSPQMSDHHLDVYLSTDTYVAQ